MQNTLALNGFIRVPSNTIISGSSFSGKSTIMAQLIEYKDYIFDHKISKIYYCFAEMQPLFKSLEKYDVIFHKGVPSIEIVKRWAHGLPIIIIFDDLADQLMSKEHIKTITNIFTVVGHHYNIANFLILHNIFYKEFRTLSLSTHNIILTKNE